MGWLVGLPLGLFCLLGGILLVVLRFAVPILVIICLILLLRRLRRGASRRSSGEPREPEFDGPVYTVDYEEVQDPEDKDDK